MKKMLFLSKNWHFSVQKALIYYTFNKSHHNSCILLVFSHVANFRYVSNFRFLTLLAKEIDYLKAAGLACPRPIMTVSLISARSHLICGTSSLYRSLAEAVVACGLQSEYSWPGEETLQYGWSEVC